MFGFLIMRADAVKVSVVSGTVIGAILIGGFPLLIIKNIDIDTFILIAKQGLLIGAISGFSMGLANGFLMSKIVSNSSQIDSSRRLYVCISTNLIVDLVIGIIPTYLSAHMLLSSTNDDIVNLIALMLGMLFISFPLTAVTVFLIAVIVPLSILGR